MTDKKTKKPDNVVFNEETERYEANILPYASNVGAPAIQIEDISSWKNYHVTKANHLFESRYSELKKAYEELMGEFEYNNLIFNAHFNFEPVLGETYHLYQGKEHVFLSMIAPAECNFDHLGSFKLNANNVWEKVINGD
ncbi:DUF2452 domain-containing protein [Sungkyunkwania multivorans]|uniref:DUF2452 domain-containing protein n=1 Tax=Sungkyunkwania multivorans TaxID=1173618 RepID=A0ABW3CYN3_9FLAO